MNIAEYMQSLGKQAREASRHLAQATTEDKNAALLATAEALDNKRQALLAANDEDMKAGAARQLDAALCRATTLFQLSEQRPRFGRRRRCS